MLVNIYAACEEGDTEKLAVNLAELQQTEYSIDSAGTAGIMKTCRTKLVHRWA